VDLLSKEPTLTRWFIRLSLHESLVQAMVWRFAPGIAGGTGLPNRITQ
jgi:hypothetical protein